MQLKKILDEDAVWSETGHQPICQSICHSISQSVSL